MPPATRSGKRHKKTVKAKRGPKKKRNLITPKFKALGGKSRRYLNLKTGKTISRRTFEKIKPPTPIAKIYGRKKAAAIIRRRREAGGRYLRLVEDYIRHKKRDNLTVTRKGVRNSESFKQIIRDLNGHDPDRKAEALFQTGRIRKEEIAEYVEKFEKEGGGVKIVLEWRVVSKKTGAVAFKGTYRECVRWLAFGTRRLRYKLESEAVEEDDEGADV